MPKFGKSAFARFLTGTVAAIVAVAPSISTVSAASTPLESIPLDYRFQNSMGQYVSQRGSEGLLTVDDQYSYWIHTKDGVRGIYRKTLTNSGTFELVKDLSAYASETLSPVRSEAEDPNFYFVGQTPFTSSYTYTFRTVNKAD